MDSPRHRRIFRVLTAAVISLLGLINLIKKDIEAGNAATTSNKISDDPLVLLRGQGKELLSPVVAFTTRAEKCTDTKFLPQQMYSRVNSSHNQAKIKLFLTISVSFFIVYCMMYISSHPI